MATALADPMSLTIHRALVKNVHRRLRDFYSARERHQLVMRFLPKGLPGPQGERRATSHVLFRVETDPQGGQNAIIHSTAPITPTGEAETREVSLASLTAPKGSLIRFRVAAHTVRRNKSTELPLPFDEVPSWLDRQVGPALGHIEILDIQRTYLNGPGQGQRSGRLQLDTIDAVAVVTDQDHLAHLVLNGIGRAKAYGAGLLTLVRIG